MDYVHHTSYSPSITCKPCEFNKMAYDLHKGSHYSSKIYVYIKLQLINGEFNYSVCVNINEAHEFTSAEWKEIFVDRNKAIRNIFTYSPSSPSPPPPPPSLSSPSIVATYELHNRLRVIKRINKNTPELFIINREDDNQNMTMMNSVDWDSINHLNPCIMSRINHMKKLIQTYENRVNFFKRYIKMVHPIDLQEANTVINRVYDENSIVDLEIKCLAIDFLFNHYCIFA